MNKQHVGSSSYQTGCQRAWKEMLWRIKYLLPWHLYTHLYIPICLLQVSCVWLRDRQTCPFPESHDRTSPMGAPVLLAALLLVRPLNQSGGRNEGSRQHAHTGERWSQWRDEVGSLYIWWRVNDVKFLWADTIIDIQKLKYMTQLIFFSNVKAAINVLRAVRLMRPLMEENHCNFSVAGLYTMSTGK